MNQKPDPSKNQKIIFYDDVCVLCSSSIDFILKRDKKAQFKFSSLKSDYAKHLFEQEQFPIVDIESIILFDDNNIYTKSTAALRISKFLSGLWPLVCFFIIVPKLIRDSVYQYIAKNRYRWFGKMESCRIIDDPLKNRFIL